MSKIEIIFVVSLLTLLASIPVIRWANSSTKEQTVVTGILEREYVKQHGVNLDMPAGTRFGNQTRDARVELPPHWSVTVRIDGERRKIMIPLEERDLAQLDQLAVTYQYLRTGEFVLLDFSQPEVPE